MSYFASQHERIRTIHSHIKDAKKTIDSLIESSYSVASLEDYDSKRIELRRSLTHFQTTIGTYSTTIASFRRQVDKMKSDTPEQQDSKKKEQKLFEELRTGDDGGIDYDDVSLSESLLPSIISVVDQTLAFAKSDAMTKMEIEARRESIHQAMSIQSQPVHDSTTTQFTPILTQNEHMSTVISTLIERLNAPPLPPITLILFDGESTQWESFYSQYSSEIGAMSHLSDHAKLVYLRNALTGAALRSVEGIPIEGKNLKSTIDRLKSVYGRSKRSNTILINQLFSIRPKSFTLEDQLECTQQLINKIHQLEDQSMVDNFALINQIAGTIHSKHLKKMYQLEPSTMKEALFHIESDLREQLEIAKLESTFRSTTRSGFHQPRERPPNPIHDKFIKPSITKPYKGPSCVYCGKHEFSHCTTITSISERKAILRDKKLCNKCLSSMHSSIQCDRKCQQCTKPHHKSICDSPSNNHKQNQSTIAASITSNHSFSGISRLFTAKASLQNPINNTSATKHVFLDAGAMVSMITRSLANELNLKPHSSLPMIISGVGGESTSGDVHDVVTVNIMTTKGLHSINALIMDTVITRSMNLHPLSSEDYEIVQAQCGDVPHLTQSTIVSPDLLIGITDTQRILADSKTITLPSGYMLTQSILGPIITGQPNSNRSISHHSTVDQSILTSLITDVPFDKRVEQYLSVDEAGREYSITEAEARLESNHKVENHFHETVEKIDGHYQVQYFIKPESVNLPTNYELACSRLRSTIHSLSKNVTHLEFYNSIINDQLTAGMIEEAYHPSDQQCHYLAHQAVLRLDKPTTPLRIVYDASAKLKGKSCLNDVISQGPCTLEHIPSLLIRARSRKTLIVADVEKAFLQVRVHPSQRDLLRFLWIRDIRKPLSKDNLIIYRFTVTPFGVNQSPFLLSKVIETHLKGASNSTNEHFINQLINNVYVDNIIINTDNPTPEMYSLSKSLFDEMHMNLRDYASNSIPFIQSVLESDRAVGDQKLLGINWNPSKDVLSIRIPSLPRHSTETKRSMLSSNASIFDPMGWLQPLILQSKLLVQQLWCHELKWDQPVDTSIQSKFHELLNDIESFNLEIPRYNSMSSSNEIHLVAFADASKLAMGTVIYLWTSEKSTILMCRSRLAPAKSKATIPKLELNALVMAHTLLKYAVDSIRKEFPSSIIHTHSYSDSAITLFWCLNDPNKKNNGPFVANRVNSIREISSSLSSIPNVHYHQPKYVRTDANPADHITRGLSANEMNDPTHMWWNGAPWMKDPPEKWPNDPIPPTADPPYARVIELAPSPLIDLNRCSSLSKAINITGFMLRFIQRLTSKSTNATLKGKFNQFAMSSTTSLSALERKRAFHSLIHNHQSSTIQTHEPWIKNGLISKDETDIWRANSRLDHSSISLDARSPILIPTSKDSKFARLLITDAHERMFHAGTENVLNQLKQQYWIPRSRQLVKSQVRLCIPCRKTNNLPYPYTTTPPFPSNRVTTSKPFQTTGIDFIGPFSSKEKEKMYAIIFTCLSSRLSHIEVTHTLLPSAFINAFRRFTSRRGTPTVVLSDQATTLKLSSTLLKGFNSEDTLNTLFQSESIQWKFTTSHAPWKGAVYERLIRIFKDCLTRSIGKRKLSLDEFSTVTSEIEAVLNTRPLTYVSSDDIHSFTKPVLRPIDLIMPSSSLAIQLHTISNNADADYHPPGEESMSRSTAISQLSRTIQIIDLFWTKWQTEYLTTIRDSKKNPDPLHSYRSCSISPKPGAIVLIIDESGNTPRSSWHMGRIISLSGSEATLKSHTGRIIQRPINLLIPLEIDAEHVPSDSNPVRDHPLPHKMTTRAKSRRQAGGNLITSMSV